MTRLIDVTKEEVESAWMQVRSAGGCAGWDEITIDDVEKDLDNQLYKIWNRMSSGSYMAQPVKLVKIPKAKGGFRILGIPTVTDRIAQMVIKNRLEKITETVFHRDSFAYRPNKSAIDAVTVCRSRCFKSEWLVEIDIKGFFDNIDHGRMNEILQKYTADKATLLYGKRFLAANSIDDDGVKTERTTGTPQGGVISPVLANLYLHEAFDKWMKENHPQVEFERYADDIVIHMKSEERANSFKSLVEGRLKEFGLALNEEKTRIVYTGTSNKHDHRGHSLHRKFTFLGYDFKPRFCKGRIVFTPGIGKGALKRIVQEVRTKWQLNKTQLNLKIIAERVSPAIRGWINYYGHHRRSDLYRLQHLIDQKLVSFLKRKYKTVKSWKAGWKHLALIRARYQKMFPHWWMISQTRGAV